MLNDVHERIIVAVVELYWFNQLSGVSCPTSVTFVLFFPFSFISKHDIYRFLEISLLRKVKHSRAVKSQKRKKISDASPRHTYRSV